MQNLLQKELAFKRFEVTNCKFCVAHALYDMYIRSVLVFC